MPNKENCGRESFSRNDSGARNTEGSEAGSEAGGASSCGSASQLVTVMFTTLYATVGLNDTSPLIANNVTINNGIDSRQRYAIGLNHRF